MNNDDTIGTHIANARRTRGWTQKQLAEATFTTQTCISYWETDQRAITAEDLLTLAAALDVPPAELIPDPTRTLSPRPPLNLTALADDLRDLLTRIERHLGQPNAIAGWLTMPTQTCDTRTGKHWHVFLHLHTGTSLRIGGLHFNTEPEAVAWASANLRQRRITHTGT